MNSFENSRATQPQSLAQVLFAQRFIMHYRLPVFDALAALSKGRYEIEVHGPMKNGEAYGGGYRKYLYDMPLIQRKPMGVLVEQMPGLTNLVNQSRPNALVTTLNPRCPQCYTLPRLCRKVGTKLIGWSKIHSFGSVPKPIMNLVRRKLFRGYHRIICYGHASANELARLGYPENRIDIAHNTVDTARIFDDSEEIARLGVEFRRSHGLKNNKIILSISRLDPEKRVDDLLDAWPQLKVLDDDLVLVIVGGGPLLEHLRMKAASIDSQRIHVLGRVPEGHDYGWIAAADVNVQCGAVGLAINQSMALGIPTVIADEWGADTEIVCHGATGWRYARGDLDALSATVQSILFDQDTTEKVTGAATRLMREEITIGNMAASIDRCLTRVLQEAE